METCHGLEIGGKALAGQNRVNAVFKRLELFAGCRPAPVLTLDARTALVTYMAVV